MSLRNPGKLLGQIAQEARNRGVELRAYQDVRRTAELSLWQAARRLSQGQSVTLEETSRLQPRSDRRPGGRQMLVQRIQLETMSGLEQLARRRG